MSVAVLGGGAFGTALALALALDGSSIALWTRDRDDADAMRRTRRSGRRLPGHDLPPSLSVAEDLPRSDIALVAVPAQHQRSFLKSHSRTLEGGTVISCAKGVEQETGLGPADVIADSVPGVRPGILTGPSFAADIARGLPTALVLAMHEGAEAVQAELTRPALRVYRTTDVTGAQLGGALKNVIAIAAGIAIGAGLGDSARASVIARGFAEMMRFALAKGAETETVQGLSGLGDLVLTCTSEKSRNFSAGLALGRGDEPGEGTVEGLATAGALAREAAALGLDVPLTRAVADVVGGTLDIPGAIATLLSRPVGKE
jgi:glycerol-3-phosphate dehydrogenase (NAD(P)+)